MTRFQYIRTLLNILRVIPPAELHHFRKLSDRLHREITAFTCEARNSPSRYKRYNTDNDDIIPLFPEDDGESFADRFLFDYCVAEIYDHHTSMSTISDD